MSEKLCTRCKETKLISEFYKRKDSKDGLQHQCKLCLHKYYAVPGTTEKYKARVKRRRHENAQKMVELKITLKCYFCDECERCCLDFHHKDSLQKDRNVSHMVTTHSWANVLKEIEKCICVCSNCHRKIHAAIIVLE
jgi:hypothetical protein